MLATYFKPTLRPLIQHTLSIRLGTTTVAARRTMSAFSQMSDNDPEVLEREKLKQMNKKDQKSWHEKLATHSEAAIKADKDLNKSTKEMQDESLNSLKDEK